MKEYQLFITIITTAISVTINSPHNLIDITIFGLQLIVQITGLKLPLVNVQNPF